MTNTIDAMNEFKITDKPEHVPIRKGKYDKLIIALKNLANDKAIEIPASQISVKFSNFRIAVLAKARKIGIEARVVEKHGSYFVFKR